MQTIIKTWICCTCFFLFLSMPNVVPGQELSWMLAYKDLEKSIPIGYHGQLGDEMLVQNGDNLLLLDAKSLIVKKIYNTKILNEGKGDWYDGMLKLENGWVAVIRNSRPYKKDGGFELKLSRLTAQGFGELKPWLAVPWKNFLNGPIIEVSPNGKYVLARMTEKQSPNKAKYIVFDANFKEVYTKEITVKFKCTEGEAEFSSIKELVDDEGNFYITGLLEAQTTKRKLPFLYYYNSVSDKAEEHVLEVEGGAINQEGFTNSHVFVDKGPIFHKGKDFLNQLDKSSGRFILAGLYGDETGGGLFSVQYDLKNNQIMPLQKHPFSDGLRQSVAKGAYDGKKIKGNLVLQDLLVKEDGSFVCLMELDGVVLEYNSMRETQKTILEARSIVYMGVNAKNELEYVGNIDKHQETKEHMSELSFVSFLSGNEVYVTLRTLSSQDDKLINYKITNRGELEKKELMQMEKRTKLLPNKINDPSNPFEWIRTTGGITQPVIISSNKVLVQGEKDGKPSLLKITY